MKSLTTSMMAAVCLATACSQAQIFNYDGQTQNANLTDHDWVLGSKMWGTLETGNGRGTSSAGFASLAALDITRFTFTFGDLELTSFLEPTAASGGFEVYSEGDGSVMPVQFFYDGDLWALGEMEHLTITVTDSNDAAAVGMARVQLTAPGVDSAFYNEVLALSEGTGLLQFEVGDFFPVNASGLFSSTGVMTPVPEPTFYATVFALGAGLFAALRRRGSAFRRVGPE